MTQENIVRVGFIGCGGMARHHIASMIQRRDTQISAICEPSADAYAAAANLFKLAGLPVPPNEPDWKKFVSTYAKQMDAVFIVTPHALHFEQAKLCMETGLDVLLEKPMVMNALEATALIETRDRTGRLLVVAFQGSLSPQVRAAVELLRSGKLGSILNINAMCWQNWGQLTVNTWRQEPALSGGGFLFDTGAHMLNTVADLAGEDFVEVAAWMENENHPVDIRAVAMARLASGGMVTFNGCGSAIPSCHSDIRVFCSKGIIRTGIWGEYLELQRHGAKRLTKVKAVQSMHVWEQFLNVRSGVTPNPSPPEVGLRMARLWDAIKASAELNGNPVKLS
ncbi:MAG: Gfo/Idh/MocA family oxidoreductase [Chloroflexi bacterium]|nr:Gfo/Idh/MocA family oxidoreductase [Chloroflexota bacterium]MCC6892161.1 Gfo/Idh/MocA family oxidoreductase [Anaerolineae bacterium]